MLTNELLRMLLGKENTFLFNGIPKLFGFSENKGMDHMIM
jgi:hypothetical protein